MDWELIFWIGITFSAWTILIFGKGNAVDPTIYQGKKDWYERYHEKEQKKWGR